MDGTEPSESQAVQTGRHVSYPPPKGGTRPSTIVAVVLIVVLLVLTTILAVNHGSILFSQSSSPGNPNLIFVDGIDRVIAYKGNITGDFGPGINDSCPWCPTGASAGGALRIPLATWNPPPNLSFWVYTNVSGPFPVLGPSCSPAPCTLPWLKLWSFETYVPAHTLITMTFFATFLLPDRSTGHLNVMISTRHSVLQPFARPRRPEMDSLVHWHCVARGRVQGVNYRVRVAESAQRHGVVGSVTNRADGTVLIDVQGELASVEAFIRDVSGPRGASHAHSVQRIAETARGSRPDRLEIVRE